jgi:hypothetical protein
MTMSFRFTSYTRVLLLALIFILLPDISSAAPYGPQKAGETVYDRLYESDTVVYGKIIQKMKSKKQGDLTEIQVLDGLKGEKWKKGDFLYVSHIIPYPVKSMGVMYLFISSKGTRDFYEINKIYPDSNKEMYEYSAKISQFMKKKDNEGRLRWLYSRVASKNEFIAWDAFSQLAASSYKDLKKAAPYINRDSLIYLISLPKVQDNRKSFYAFLLGLANKSEDIALIKRQIENPSNSNSQIVFGAMMAYALLSKDYPSYFHGKMEKETSENIKLAVLEAVKNIMVYEKPNKPALLLKCLNYVFTSGNRNLVLKALSIAGEIKITSSVQYMRSLYFERFSKDAKVKTDIINYLKFVRKKSPDAVRLLKEIKLQETDPNIKEIL